MKCKWQTFINLKDRKAEIIPFLKGLADVFELNVYKYSIHFNLDFYSINRFAPLNNSINSNLLD